MRAIPRGTKTFLEKEEGIRRKVYLDSAGIPTVGIGHTGPDVKMGETWTDGQITAAFAKDVNAAAQAIPLPQEIIDSLGDNQYMALISFVFNVGPRPEATLWKRIKQKNYGAVPSELAKWNKARVNGVLHTLPGLTSRREREAQLWLKDCPPAPVALTNSSLSANEIEIVPTFADPEPKKGFFAGIVATISAVLASGGTLIKQIIDSVSPYSHISPIVGSALTALGALGAGFAAYAAYKAWEKSQEGKR